MCMPLPKPPAPAATAAHGLSPTLIRARADYAHSSLTAWAFVVFCTSSFYIGPLVLLAPFYLCPFYPKAAAMLLCFGASLALHPVSPWPRFRKACQLFYTVFDVRHNFTPELDEIARREKRLSIFAMHPHAIVPLHGYVWVALCDQLIPHMYGYGTTTDAVMKIPLLRHMLGFFGVGSASKHAVLTEMQKKDQNLYILPGGVAEIFLSRPRQHTDDLSRPSTQTIKARRYGLMRLALETGAAIYPMFVFGASDMLDQLTPAPVDGGVADHRRSGKDGSLRDAAGSFVERVSRSMRSGLTVFYGRYGLPVPHAPRLSMVMGDPIFPVLGDAVMKNASGDKVTCKRIENPTEEQVEELMGRYVYAMYRLFEQYKAEAGYPKEKLYIV